MVQEAGQFTNRPVVERNISRAIIGIESELSEWKRSDVYIRNELRNLQTSHLLLTEQCRNLDREMEVLRAQVQLQSIQIAQLHALFRFEE